MLSKPTYDSRLYDLPCAGIMQANETIATIVSITCDQGALTFGTPAINSAVTSYGAPIGTVIQVQISAGTIPAGMASLPCTITAKITGSINPNQMAWRDILVLDDTVGVD
jgi:hypothetical protein